MADTPSSAAAELLGRTKLDTPLSMALQLEAAAAASSGAGAHRQAEGARGQAGSMTAHRGSKVDMVAEAAAEKIKSRFFPILDTAEAAGKSGRHLTGSSSN